MVGVYLHTCSYCNLADWLHLMVFSYVLASSLLNDQTNKMAAHLPAHAGLFMLHALVMDGALLRFGRCMLVKFDPWLRYLMFCVVHW